MRDWLTQFRDLDMKDPGAWPPAPKLVLLGAVMAAVLAMAYTLDWRSQLDAIDAGRVEEGRLKDAYVAKMGQAVNLDLYRTQLAEIDKSFGALIRQLPDKSQMEALIDDINRSGVASGLHFELFKPAPDEIKKEFYAELPIAIRVTGTYHEMGSFSGKIGNLSRIVTLNDMNVAVTKDNQLVMDAVAKTFRYLDEEELAEQRRAADEAKKKAAKKAAPKAAAPADKKG